jgi:hypothetical protein
MSVCPHCGKEMKFPSPAPEHNVLSYGKPALTVTECCGKGVYLHRVQRIRVEPYYGPAREDDWCYKVKAAERPAASDVPPWEKNNAPDN